MNMVTYNGGDPSHIRLRNVTSAGVEFQIEEWDYLDQSHLAETMAYIVLEQGEFILAAGRRLQVGMVTASHVWWQVDFLDMGGTPVVFSQGQTYMGGEAVVTRQRNVGPGGFDLCLQKEEAKGSLHIWLFSRF